MFDRRQAVIDQLNSTPSDLYEVGIQKILEDGSKYMLPRTWDEKRLLASMPWLSYMNATDGCGILVRPQDQRLRYSVLDDINNDAIAQMKTTGYEPCAIIETSPKNFQTWLDHGELLKNEEEGTAAAKILTKTFGGDPSSADWRHFSRLVGFTNTKEKHRNEKGQFPWCMLVDHRPGTYARAGEVIGQARERVRLAREEVESWRRAYRHFRGDGKEKPIENFRGNPKYYGDGHVEDFAYALANLARGVDVETIANRIRTRDLSKKGGTKDQRDYVNRTIKNAQRKLGINGNTHQLSYARTA